MASTNGVNRLLRHSIFEHTLMARFHTHILNRDDISIAELLEKTRSEIPGASSFMPLSAATILSQLQFTFTYFYSCVRSDAANKEEFSAVGVPDIPIRIYQDNRLISTTLTRITIADGLKHLRNVFSHLEESISVDTDADLICFVDRNIYKGGYVTFDMRISPNELQPLLVKLQEYWISNLN